jgi:ATP-binding cassette subfamily G (WHITE) protein 2 (SNQ2)
MNPYISFAGGYLANPNATSSCQFCGVRTTDALIGANFNIFYDHHWRNFGLMMAFILFNVRMPFRVLFLQQLTSEILSRYSAFSL